MIVPETHLAMVSAKAHNKWQSRAAIPVICPTAGADMGTGTEEEGQAADITGWMRPSGDVTAPGATSLSEVKRIIESQNSIIESTGLEKTSEIIKSNPWSNSIKLLVAKPALGALGRFTWQDGPHSFKLHFTWH
ncbi:hypothetical protein WISP_37247 [Willisornis vidua]|uniref:POK18 protein n=1 Tax=Willisornis vidua TaxID=1566151 RepID=A0ABQ9DJG7_9PASS|nr:hypothetical protein WISP_37247 [Willisornis vidua]